MPTHLTETIAIPRWFLTLKYATFVVIGVGFAMIPGLRAWQLIRRTGTRRG